MQMLNMTRVKEGPFRKKTLISFFHGRLGVLDVSLERGEETIQCVEPQEIWRVMLLMVQKSQGQPPGMFL